MNPTDPKNSLGAASPTCRINKMDIGIFGGSFNPIHIGHTHCCRRGISSGPGDYQKVIFMPTGISPHKESSDLVDSSHRYQMVKKCNKSDNEHLEVSDIEIKRSEILYTIDTIRIFTGNIWKNTISILLWEPIR